MLGSHQNKGGDLKTDDFAAIGTDKIKTEFGDVPELEHEVLPTRTVDHSRRNVEIDIHYLNNDLHKELYEKGVDKRVNAKTQVEREEVLAHQKHGETEQTDFQENMVHLQASHES